MLLNGSAYAPDGGQATEVTVGLRLGSVSKSFAVVGPRHWERVLLAVKPSAPEPFARLPIGYDQAFGGRDAAKKNPDKQKFYLPNPVGTGYYPLTSGGALVGRPLPCTAEVGNPVNGRTGRYKPMAFGAIGRNFAVRHPLAGTYDQDWQDNVFPFLPADFDPLYHQSAPADQQIPYPRGGEKVRLVNLTPQGRTGFRLPTVSMPVEFTDADRERTRQEAVLDTVIIEPDLERLLLVWRTSIPLKRNIHEMKQCVVGTMPRGWYRARDLGKTYYRSLAQLGAGGRGLERRRARGRDRDLRFGHGDRRRPGRAVELRGDPRGHHGFVETRFMFGGEWLQGCPVPLDEPWRGTQKLARMAAAAVGECLGAEGGAGLARHPLLLCVAEADRPGRFADLGPGLLTDVAAALGGTLHPDSRVFAGGPDGRRPGPGPRPRADRRRRARLHHRRRGHATWSPAP